MTDRSSLYLRSRRDKRRLERINQALVKEEVETMNINESEREENPQMEFDWYDEI